MTNANIIIPEANKVEIIDKPIPVPKSGEVLVRLERSTVSSGTERANYVGEVNVNILTNDGVARWPRQGGYSSSGIVEAVGEGVKSLKPGDRVAMSWTVSWTRCIRSPTRPRCTSGLVRAGLSQSCSSTGRIESL